MMVAVKNNSNVCDVNAFGIANHVIGVTNIVNTNIAKHMFMVCPTARVAVGFLNLQP